MNDGLIDQMIGLATCYTCEEASIAEGEFDIYLGENILDAHDNGVQDGRILMAREILEDLGIDWHSIMVLEAA